MKSFSEFWPFYVRQHAHKGNRNLHFVGTTLSLLSIVAGIEVNAWFFVAAPICGYFFAWLGHLGIEKNRPATWQHPVWSLLGDFRMFGLIIAGRMDQEVEKFAGSEKNKEVSAPTA